MLESLVEFLAYVSDTTVKIRHAGKIDWDAPRLGVGILSGAKFALDAEQLHMYSSDFSLGLIWFYGGEVGPGLAAFCPPLP